MPEMTPLERLPLPLAALPAGVQRFCDPSGPTAARMMAAKGLVPVRGHDQIIMLAQFASDQAKELRDAALRTIKGLPEQVLAPACEAPLPAGVLDFLAELFAD